MSWYDKVSWAVSTILQKACIFGEEYSRYKGICKKEKYEASPQEELEHLLINWFQEMITEMLWKKGT